MKVILYTPEQVAATVAEGAAGFTSPAQWVSKMRAAFAGIVTRNPLAYRSFGPYWWPIKRMMVEAGDLNGTVPDPEVEAEVSLGDAVSNIAAAFLYHDWSTTNMTAMNTSHTVDTDSGDPGEYVLIDDEMESRAALAASFR